MTPQQITEAWLAAFGPVGPAGFLCREALPDRWIRIHSLPDSKRYPTDEQERAELLRRHLAVAGAVLREPDCHIFVSRFGTSDDVSRENLVSNSEFLRVDGMPSPDEEELMQFFVSPFNTSSANFRDLIFARANDEIGPILFANLSRATAYAPYDGGADLFFPSAEMAMFARKAWASWLSDRTDGL